MRYFAKGYVRRPMGPTLVEIWVEAAGMIPQIEAVAHPFGVKVMGTGGFDSLTAHHATAQRLLTEAGDRPILVLLIGDLDPSGGSIMDSGAEDVAAFSGEHPAQFVRLAVTPEQVQEHNLDTAPQKEKDIRGEHMDETVQAEALDPGVLAQIVTARLTDLVPQDAIDEAARLTEQEKAEILEQLPEPSDDEEEDPDE